MELSTPVAGIVIPTYREQDNICALILAVLKAVPNSEIIVVDDSPDLETVKAVESLHLRNVAVVHRAEKGGRGSAVLVGIDQLIKKSCLTIVEMDADFSHPPNQIAQLLAVQSEKNLDLLIASRYLPGSTILNWPYSRRIFSRSSNWLARLLLGVPISDYTNGFRVYSRSAAQLILNTCGKLGKGFISLSEILVNLYYRGYKVSEVPTIFTNRLRGESSISTSEISNAAVGLLQIFRLKRKLTKKK